MIQQAGVAINAFRESGGRGCYLIDYMGAVAVRAMSAKVHQVVSECEFTGANYLVGHSVPLFFDYSALVFNFSFSTSAFRPSSSVKISRIGGRGGLVIGVPS